jgi:hypothetical protein
MPLVERTSQIAAIYSNLLTSFIAYNNKEKERSQHTRFVIYGGPGTGKTRFGVDCLFHTLEWAKTNRRNSDDDNRFMDCLEHALTIHVTFANGSELLEEETKTAKLMQEAVVTRMILFLFNLHSSTPPRTFREHYPSACQLTISDVLDLASIIYPTAKMFFIHLDEISPMIFNVESRKFSGIIITGTIYEGGGVPPKHSNNYPTLNLKLTPLSSTGVTQVVNSLLEKKELKHFSKTWNENLQLGMALAAASGIPCLLELLLNALKEKQLEEETIENAFQT